jgi:hypothetical protein
VADTWCMTETVYVELRDEGVAVWRPVEAVRETDSTRHFVHSFGLRRSSAKLSQGCRRARNMTGAADVTESPEGER